MMMQMARDMGLYLDEKTPNTLDPSYHFSKALREEARRYLRKYAQTEVHSLCPLAASDVATRSASSTYEAAADRLTTRRQAFLPAFMRKRGAGLIAGAGLAAVLGIGARNLFSAMSMGRGDRG